MSEAKRVKETEKKRNPKQILPPANNTTSNFKNHFCIHLLLSLLLFVAFVILRSLHYLFCSYQIPVFAETLKISGFIYSSDIFIRYFWMYFCVFAFSIRLELYRTKYIHKIFDDYPDMFSVSANTVKLQFFILWLTFVHTNRL